MMNEETFWELVEGLPPVGAGEALRERLRRLEPAEIAAFESQFRRASIRAYDWMLWAAAYIIEGGCSDDGFTDFRSGLISRGRKVFEAALSDPDSLADVASDDDEDDSGYIPNEEFAYVAAEVYEEKAGSEMPYEVIPRPSDPAGEDWDFDDEALCAAKLPRLWAKFGE